MKTTLNTYCNDVVGLFTEMGMDDYDANEWRLFIDGSTSSLKAVLLHVTNKKPAIPLALGTGIKECYDTLNMIINDIKYFDHNWKVCCDLKVVNILQGIIDKGGYPKYFCYKCEFDSRLKTVEQFKKRDWKPRDLHDQKHLRIVNEPIN